MRLLKFLLAIVPITFSSTVSAGSISLINAGFEDPDIGNGASIGWSSVMPQGWDQNLPFGATLLDPTSGLQAYEGEQYMLFQVDNRTGDKQISQTTSEVLTAGNTYLATVWLGARGNGDSWGTIGLRAGNTLLDWERLVVPGKQSSEISHSEWYQLSLSYTATVADANLGEFLSIDLWRDQGMGSAAFDDVGFSVSSASVPEPSAILLCLLGMAGLSYQKRIRMRR